MFDTDAFVAECRAARDETEPRLAVREVLERALTHPGAVADRLHPHEGGLRLLYHAPDLTVIHFVWAPRMVLFPHDHRMWAAIGIYTGQEDNTFYRRAVDAPTVVESGGKHITAGEVLLLGDDAIHGVANPRDHLAGAIHVYGGDFVNEPRSQWVPGSDGEAPFDMALVNRQFAEANAAWRAATTN